MGRQGLDPSGPTQAVDREGGTEGALWQAFARWEEHAERRWRWYLVGFCLLIGVLAAVISACRPYWADEIFTFYVSRQKSLADVYRVLAQGADNHPPLDYWVRHLSMGLFGTSTLAERLPSVLGFAASLAFLFAVCRRPWGVTAGLIAAGTLLLSQANAMSYNGRSYALVVLSVTAGLWLWRRAADGRGRPGALAGLALLFFAAPCLHFYAPFHMAGIVVAEMARTWMRRSVDLALWAAFAAAALALPILLPILAYAKQFAKGFWTPVTLPAALSIYSELFANGLGALFLVLATATVLHMVPGRRPQQTDAADRGLPELWAAVYLVCLPLVVFALALVGTGALNWRYALSTAIGTAIALAAAARHSRPLRLACLVVIGLYATGMFGLKAVSAVRNRNAETTANTLLALARSSTLPIVVDDSDAFIEGTFFASPELRQRLIFPLDPETALRLTGQAWNQRAVTGLQKVAPLPTSRLEEILKAHPRFVLFRPNGWVSRRMVELGHRVTLRTFQGQFIADVDTTSRSQSGSPIQPPADSGSSGLRAAADQLLDHPLRAEPESGGKTQ